MAVAPTAVAGQGRPGTVVAATPAANTTLEDGRVIFGPPPPVPPEVVSRDELGRATVRAVRIDQPLDVDGRLDEAVYSTVKPITRRSIQCAWAEAATGQSGRDPIIAGPAQSAARGEA